MCINYLNKSAPSVADDYSWLDHQIMNARRPICFTCLQTWCHRLCRISYDAAIRTVTTRAALRGIPPWRRHLHHCRRWVGVMALTIKQIPHVRDSIRTGSALITKELSVESHWGNCLIGSLSPFGPASVPLFSPLPSARFAHSKYLMLPLLDDYYQPSLLSYRRQLVLIIVQTY